MIVTILLESGNTAQCKKSCLKCKNHWKEQDANFLCQRFHAVEQTHLTLLYVTIIAKPHLVIIWVTLPHRDPYRLKTRLSVMRLHLGEEVAVRCFSENECSRIPLDTADATSGRFYLRVSHYFSWKG